jgi:hypothetical protein
MYPEIDSGLANEIDKEIRLWNAIAPDGAKIERLGTSTLTTTQMETVIQQMHGVIAPTLANAVKAVAHIDGLSPDTALNYGLQVAQALSDTASLAARATVNGLITTTGSKYGHKLPGLSPQYGSSAVGFKWALYEAAISFQRAMHPKSDVKMSAMRHPRVRPGDINSPKLAFTPTTAAIGNSLVNYAGGAVADFNTGVGVWEHVVVTSLGAVGPLLEAALAVGTRYVIEVLNYTEAHAANAPYILRADSTVKVDIDGIIKTLGYAESGVWTVSGNPNMTVTDSTGAANSCLLRYRVRDVLIDDPRNISYVIGDTTLAVGQSSETIDFLGKTSAGLAIWGEAHVWEQGVQVLFEQTTIRDELRTALTSVARKKFGAAFAAITDTELSPWFYFSPAAVTFFGNASNLESFYYIYHSLMTGYLMSLSIDAAVQSTTVRQAYL